MGSRLLGVPMTSRKALDISRLIGKPLYYWSKPKIELPWNDWNESPTGTWDTDISTLMV